MNFRYETLTLHYEVIGNGKPVVILHGLGCDMDIMKASLEPVFQTKPQYKRIYIDLPGMGQSGKDLAYASSDRILEVLTAFINETVEENFLLMGESYGGYLIRGILSTFDGRVDGMMMLCPVVIPERDKRILPIKSVQFREPVSVDDSNNSKWKDFYESAVIVNEHIYKRYCEEVAKELSEGAWSFIMKLKEQYSFSFDVDQIIRNMKYDKPVLFVCGKQDTCVGFEDAWRISCDYSRATFSVVDVAGHNLQIEQPELFESLVRNWLTRVEQL